MGLQWQQQDYMQIALRSRQRRQHHITQTVSSWRPTNSVKVYDLMCWRDDFTLSKPTIYHNWHLVLTSLTYLLATYLSSVLLRPLHWLFSKLLSKSAKLTRPQFSTSTSIWFIPGFARSKITWSSVVQSTVSISSPFNRTCYQSAQWALAQLLSLCACMFKMTTIITHTHIRLTAFFPGQPG